MAEDRISYDAFVRFLATPLNDGRPFVLETQHALSLHFDHFGTQSFMSLRDPGRLAGYTRVMMGFLLLQPGRAYLHARKPAAVRWRSTATGTCPARRSTRSRSTRT